MGQSRDIHVGQQKEALPESLDVSRSKQLREEPAVYLVGLDLKAYCMEKRPRSSFERATEGRVVTAKQTLASVARGTAGRAPDSRAVVLVLVVAEEAPAARQC